MSAQSESAPERRGRPLGSVGARGRRQQLVKAYVDTLGGSARVGPIVMQDVERAADLVLLARDMRAAVRQGTAKVSDLTRLEGAADRAVRRLNLPPPKAAAAVQTLQDYLASHTEAGDTS